MSGGMFQELNSREQDLVPETPQAQSQSQPTQVSPLSTSRLRPAHSPGLFMLQSDTSDDEIEQPPGWRQSNPTQQQNQVQDSMQKYFTNLLNPLSMSIDEEDVFGPLVTKLYETLARLKSQPTCEVLLYLSGHGMDPGNICLVPKAMKPHPTRSEHDLREIDPDNWYEYNDDEAKEAERCLEEFYCKYAEAFGDYSGPLGFVGGEVYAHQRGYIGVLGVLGLWCYAHKCSQNGFFHHLVIVADCCFAGIWGATLDRIMKSTEPCLEEYRLLLLKYPVSIQCATNKFEASHGGSFTPLWYFLQTASQLQLKKYESEYEEYKCSHGEPVSHDFETQHPWFISTSGYAPSCECFGNPDFFVYLLGEQRKELQHDLKDCRNRMALTNACSSETEMSFSDIVNKLQGFSPLARPYVTALAGAALNLRENLQVKKRQVENCNRPHLTSDYQHQRLLDRFKKSIHIIEQSLADLSKLQLMPLPRFRPGGYVLDKENRLTEASRRQLREKLQPRDQERAIAPGVYVFQGGEGDMSLIVTSGQEQVILIDGTKTAVCFKAAWDSTLRYLPRITHIFVTHHDVDHTKGIQMLLARYWVGQEGIPDISRTVIYMNTRAALRRRSFGHEEEIEYLANELQLGLLVKSFIINRHCLCVDLHMQKDFSLAVLLPRQQLVDECRGKVPEVGQSTEPVSSRGGTTAANVLSINVVAVWKKRDAYLFTGDAHLKDVTQAAKDFLRIHDMESFKYVDVPHHGSAHSNVTNVGDRDRGLAGIPAEHYLISHCGNHQNPSLRTVTHILKRDRCRKLHFLYPARKQSVSCRRCQECDNSIERRNWHCECVKDFQHKIDTALHDDGPFKFFPFY